MTEREACIHRARVGIAECRARRNCPVNRNWYWVLFAWAQRNRRLAARIEREPEQGGLFA